MTITIKDNQGTLPGANIYASDAIGNYLTEGFGVAADENGQATIPDNLEFITISCIGYKKQTFDGDDIPAIITMQEEETILDTVTITASATEVDLLPWFIAGVFALLLILYLFTLKSKP